MRTNIFVTTFWRILGVVLIIGAWYYTTRDTNPLLFPGPLDIWDAFIEILETGALVEAFLLTVLRAAGGLAVAAIIGIPFGFLTGYILELDYMSRAFITMVMGIPPIVVVVMSQVWFGTTTIAVIFVVGIVIAPMLIVSTRDSVRSIDPDLLEMAHVFGLSRIKKLRHIIVPAIVQPVATTFIIAIGTCIRVTIMGELLLTTTGMGAGIRQAQINIETSHIFAYAICIAIIAVCFEYLLIKPIQRRRKTAMQH